MSLENKSDDKLIQMYNSLSTGRTATKILMGIVVFMLIGFLGAGVEFGVVLVVGAIFIPLTLLWHRSICKKCDDIIDELDAREEAREAEKKKKREALHETMRQGTWTFPVDKFSKACYEEQIFDIDSPYNLQKAKAIAQNILRKSNVPADAQAGYLTTEKMQEYFAGAKVKIDEKEKSRLKSVRDEEKARQKEMTKYAEHIGRDKWISMINEILIPLRKREKERRKAVDAAFKLASMPGESEVNPYLAGGIASGLGGTGAGVIAAMDAERQNAAARERTAQSQQYWRDMGVRLALSGPEVSVSSLEKELKKAETAAISDMPDDEVFEKLVISGGINVTETGAVEIVAKIELLAPIKVFGEVPTKVDGTIAANIYKGNRKMGTALLVLPRKGVAYDGKSKTEVYGIYLGKADPNGEYSVKFAPHHLWVMEA